MRVVNIISKPSETVHHFFRFYSLSSTTPTESSKIESVQMNSAQNVTDDFLKFTIKHEVLRFGNFTLKSGRMSPYFFNLGSFNSGSCLSKLGDFYASAIYNSKLEFDVIFGLAYKGIPLATTTVVSLYNKYGLDIPYIINRKEGKGHGEGGLFIGSTESLKKSTCRILVVDDVITAGTAIREAVMMLRPFKNCKIVGVIVALDREERMDTGLTSDSAASVIMKEFNTAVVPILKFSDLEKFVECEAKDNSVVLLEGVSNLNVLRDMKAFRKEYGAVQSN